MIYLDIADIDADPKFNGRMDVSKLSVINLISSIKDRGLMQPLCVRVHPTKTGKYSLIYGFRRLKAIQVLKEQGDWEVKIPCTLADVTEEDAVAMNLAENLDRKDISMLEESRSIGKLRKLGLDNVKISAKLKQSTAWVDSRVKLASLPEDVQKVVSDFVFSAVQINNLYKVFISGHVDRLHELCVKYKEVKQSGNKLDKKEITRLLEKERARKNPSSSRKKLTKQEGMRISEEIISQLGDNIASLAIFLTLGEISEIEFYRMAKEISNLDFPESLWNVGQPV